MMDERLIGEVECHAIIYNRQKTNMFNGDKSANKEMAWLKIAHTLGTDADTCKKRWKYLRERYVQQKKVGDTPSYEHLSRPYLEKMRFLDNFIQPRKSYRNVAGLLIGSPGQNSATSSNHSNSHQSTGNAHRNGGGAPSSFSHARHQNPHLETNSSHAQPPPASACGRDAVALRHIQQQHQLHAADDHGLMHINGLTDSRPTSATTVGPHQQRLNVSQMMDQFHTHLHSTMGGHGSGADADPTISNENLKLFDPFNNYVQHHGQQGLHGISRNPFGEAAVSNAFQHQSYHHRHLLAAAGASVSSASAACRSSANGLEAAVPSLLNGSADSPMLAADRIKNELNGSVTSSLSVASSLVLEHMQMPASPTADAVATNGEIAASASDPAPMENDSAAAGSSASATAADEDSRRATTTATNGATPGNAADSASHRKRRRICSNNNRLHLSEEDEDDEEDDNDDDDEDDDDQDGGIETDDDMTHAMKMRAASSLQRIPSSASAGAFSSEFLYPFYQHGAYNMQQQPQQLHHNQHSARHHLRPATSSSAAQQHHHAPHPAPPPPPPVRQSEQLLGELVTAELLKMDADRRKVAQKKILAILFFDE